MKKQEVRRPQEKQDQPQASLGVRIVANILALIMFVTAFSLLLGGW